MADDLALAARADELYAERGQDDAVAESVRLLTGATAQPGSYEVQWRLSRALFFLGQEAAPGAKSQLHAAGIGAGERAVELVSDRVEGHFWLGVNLALFAESHGGIKGARALLRARKALLRSVAINESYHGAGPLRVLGRLEHKAPWLLGGSAKRSRQCFDRALVLEPGNSVTLLYAAQYFLDVGERERSRTLLNRLIAGQECSEWAYEMQRDREAARKLLDKLNPA